MGCANPRSDRAPSEFAAKITAAALARARIGTTSASTTIVLLQLMNVTKIQIGQAAAFFTVAWVFRYGREPK